MYPESGDKTSNCVFKETRFSHNHAENPSRHARHSTNTLSWLYLTALSCRQIPQTEIGHRKSNEGEIRWFIPSESYPTQQPNNDT